MTRFVQLLFVILVFAAANAPAASVSATPPRADARRLVSHEYRTYVAWLAGRAWAEGVTARAAPAAAARHRPAGFDWADVVYGSAAAAGALCAAGGLALSRRHDTPPEPSFTPRIQGGSS
jgi:hypothetical protein